MRERVLVFDGAFGTWVQDQDLGPDDFGGPALEGCNEHLVLTRPDAHPPDARRVLRGRRRRGRDRHLRRLLAWCSPSTASPTRPTSINEAAARLAKEVAAEFSTPDRPRFVIGSIGPGTKLPSLGQIAFADAARRLRGPGRRPARRRRRRPPRRDRPGPPPGQGRDHRRAAGRWPPPGREVPLMVQVTMETTGRMLVGSEIGAALTALEAMRPDVIGLNCATGPGGDDRAPALPRAALRAPSCRACPTRACRRSSTATRTTTSRPTRSPTRTSASSPSSASTSSAAAAAPRPRTCARSSSASAPARRSPRTAEYEPALLVDLQPGHRSTRSSRSSPSASAPTPTAPRSSASAMLDGDWDIMRADGHASR